MKTYRRKPPSKQAYARHSVGQLGSAAGYRLLSEATDSERMASRGGRSGPSSGATLSSSRLRLSLLGTRERSNDVFSDVKRDSSPKANLGSTGSCCGAMAAVLGGGGRRTAGRGQWVGSRSERGNGDGDATRLDQTIRHERGVRNGSAEVKREYRRKSRTSGPWE